MKSSLLSLLLSTSLAGVANTQPCPVGDLNGDCEVSKVDLDLFAGQWLDSADNCPGPDCAELQTDS